MKKDIWTEEEILSILFESDNFERKSGRLLDDGDFEATIAKAMSAFANTEGGHIVLGASDDGSLDGTKPIHKGRTSIRQWLEQKLPTLLAPSLQDFRVHEISPTDSSSLIPTGKVLVVVDIGKSDLAPHQSIPDLTYYYRVGSHSRRAPHRYLELLFSREKFPGPRVANAWVQTVLNPLIGTLRQEASDLENERWGLDMYRPDTLNCVTVILNTYKSLNAEQFFMGYKDLFDQVQIHDEKARLLIAEVEKCHRLMSHSFQMNGLYENVTSVDLLTPLAKDSPENTYKFRECKERADFVKILFSDDDPVRNSRILVQCMINGSLLGNDYTFEPLWRLHEQKFLSERDSLYRNEMSWIRTATAEVLTETNILLALLETERINLCRKYGLPFEEQSPVYLAQAQSIRPF